MPAALLCHSQAGPGPLKLKPGQSTLQAVVTAQRAAAPAEQLRHTFWKRPAKPRRLRSNIEWKTPPRRQGH